MFAFVEELKQCALFFRHNNERLRSDANEKTSEPTKNVINFAVASTIEECVQLPRSLLSEQHQNSTKVLGSYEISLDRLKRAKPNPKTNFIEVNCGPFRLNLTRISPTEYALEGVTKQQGGDGGDVQSNSKTTNNEADHNHPRSVFERIKQDVLVAVKNCTDFESASSDNKDTNKLQAAAAASMDYVTSLTKRLVLLKHAANRYQSASKDILAFSQSVVAGVHLRVAAQIKVEVECTPVRPPPQQKTSSPSLSSSPKISSSSTSTSTSSSSTTSSPSIDRNSIKRTVVVNTRSHSSASSPIAATQLSSNGKRKVHYGDNHGGNNGSSTTTTTSIIPIQYPNSNKKKKYNHHHHQPQHPVIRKPFIKK